MNPHRMKELREWTNRKFGRPKRMCVLKDDANPWSGADHRLKHSQRNRNWKNTHDVQSQWDQSSGSINKFKLLFKGWRVCNPWFDWKIKYNDRITNKEVFTFDCGCQVSLFDETEGDGNNRVGCKLCHMHAMRIGVDVEDEWKMWVSSTEIFEQLVDTQEIVNITNKVV